MIIVIAALGGNWGNNGNSAFGGGAPIIVNDGGANGGAVQRGFDQAAVMSGINGVQSGVQNLSTQLCNCCCDMRDTVNQGFFGTQTALNNGFANAETAENARQMATTQQIYGLSTQFADCCCENRLGIADLKYTIATENCADRAAISDGIRDVITNQTANTQRILDKLCSLELDNYRRENDQLRTQLNMANLAASQTAQTAQIRDGQVSAVTALVNELRSCPIPSQPVYGSQPIFTCPQNNNCGCGCGGVGGFNGNF